MIRFEGIHKSYDEKQALAGVDIELPTGKISVIIGPSGCGKSTFLKLINRMIDPDDGRILIDGSPVLSKSPPPASPGNRLCHPGNRAFSPLYSGGKHPHLYHGS